MQLIAVNRKLDQGPRRAVTLASFALPILLWALISYVPFLWHPQVEITQPGSVSYFSEGLLVDREIFEREYAKASDNETALPEGKPANPVYLPAPHEVAVAFVSAHLPLAKSCWCCKVLGQRKEVED